MRRSRPRPRGAPARGDSSAPFAARRGGADQDAPRDDVAAGEPPAQPARASVDAWREIGASRWVRRALKFGLRLPWLTPRGRPRTRCRPYPTGGRDGAFVDEELDRWTQAGFVRRMSEAEAAAAPCVSPAFVSWDRPEKPRLVVDLRQVNEHLRGTKCKYEALFEFMSSFLPDDHLILWDIKDAYHHLYIHPNDRPYLNFTVGGHTYEAITMPFGLSVAPWAWTKITRPVLSALREAHFKLIGYVDDHGAAAPGRRPVSKRDGAAGFRKVALLYDKLGLSLHPSKGERQGTQQLTLLGYTIDKAGNAVRLPDVRVAKLWGGAAAILSSERKTADGFGSSCCRAWQELFSRDRWQFPRRDCFPAPSTTTWRRRIQQVATAGSPTIPFETSATGPTLAATATGARSGRHRRRTPSTPTRLRLGGVGCSTGRRQCAATSRAPRRTGTST